MPKNKSINLLPQEEFDVSILGRTLKWAMGTFRIIVIVTEMIVMAAFMSRFWLDALNSDLSNAIKIKSAQVSAMAKTEKDFRSVQSKLNIVQQISAATPYSQRIDTVVSKTPPEVTLTSISVLDDSILIRGLSSSELGIAQYVANLKADSSLASADLEQTNSSENNAAQTIFSIKVTY